MTIVLRLAITWTCFGAFWLLFVYQASVSELLAASAASAIAAFSFYVITRSIPLDFRPRLYWIAQAYLLPGMIGQELWVLFKCLLRDIRGVPSRSSFVMTPFTFVTDSRYSAAQCALATLFVSTTPNSVVLDIDSDNRKLFYHQLEPAPVPTILRRLER